MAISKMDDLKTASQFHELTKEQIREQQRLRKVEGSNFYWKKFLVILTSVLLTLLFTLFRGNALSFIFEIQRCQFSDFATLAVYLLLATINCLVGFRVVSNEQKQKEACKWNFSPNEFQWTKKTLSVSGLLSIVMGVLSSIGGVGGGLMMNPFMMELGFLPTVVTYTSMYLIFVGKFVIVIYSIILNTMIYDYSLILGFFSLCGIFLSEMFFQKLVKKFQRQSMLSAVFAALTMGSMTIVVYTGIMSILDGVKEGVLFLDFEGFCKVN